MVRPRELARHIYDLSSLAPTQRQSKSLLAQRANSQDATRAAALNNSAERQPTHMDLVRLSPRQSCDALPNGSESQPPGEVAPILRRPHRAHPLRPTWRARRNARLQHPVSNLHEELRACPCPTLHHHNSAVRPQVIQALQKKPMCRIRIAGHLSERKAPNRRLHVTEVRWSSPPTGPIRRQTQRRKQGSAEASTSSGLLDDPHRAPAQGRPQRDGTPAAPNLREPLGEVDRWRKNPVGHVKRSEAVDDTPDHRRFPI